jgi:hypothetical protein
MDEPLSLCWDRFDSVVLLALPARQIVILSRHWSPACRFWILSGGAAFVVLGQFLFSGYIRVPGHAERHYFPTLVAGRTILDFGCMCRRHCVELVSIRWRPPCCQLGSSLLLHEISCWQDNFGMDVPLSMC